ncbi:uracil-DNA glycosylase [Salirhabdus salicampi]|uniref:uracil-DNA glycosylase n=1 Tax=Salirhabdus salicampi TaxID=476102 RepID=UPI0020C2309F|nr:uracil-DNA glycosylase [Salirhabdus salicampi]MCP8616098.1 uracil-DNA glycosylase [Salirhabdus salicampi]
MQLPNDWHEILKGEFQKSYFQTLKSTLEKEYRNTTVYPKEEEVFQAFHYTAYHATKVVLLGQDPYHGLNQAHGLSFSVRKGEKIPPSLRNIYRELHEDINCPIPNHGCLVDWAKRGVLLLNTVLTVRAHEANSHQKIGWDLFTNEVIRLLNERDKPVVFILWGRQAQQKKGMIHNHHHLIIEAPHPSPLSARRGFFGSRPFSKTNNYLQSIGEPTIDWEIS